MAFSALASLSLVMVIGGTCLLMISMILTRRLRRHSANLQALLQIGTLNLEPLAIAGVAWPILAGAGWRELVMRGDWFGHPIHSVFGGPKSGGALPSSSQTLLFQITSSADVHLTLQFMHPRGQGERWLLAEQLAGVFAILLETSLRVRTEALSAALAERARLSLYLQHDMRNLAQWVSWVGADFAACTSEQDLLRLARRLQENSPLAQERALRLISALGKRPTDDRPASIDLTQAVTQAAHLAGIEIEVSGQAQGWIAKSLLLRALDNLFSNLAPNWREAVQARPVVQLRRMTTPASQPARVEMLFFSPLPPGTEQISPEKLFEPFASGRPSGLGLGLYQARQSLREAGGDLQANSSPGGVSFALEILADAP